MIVLKYNGAQIAPHPPGWDGVAAELAAVNQHVTRLRVSIDGRAVSGRQLQYTRVFHLDAADSTPSAATHGRWYSRFQELDGDVRGRALIDGQECIELDVANCQCTILSHAAGIEPPERDIYSPRGAPADMRPAYKKLWMILLNASSREQGEVAWEKWWRAEQEAGRISRRASHAAAARRMEDSLPPGIRARMWSGAGKYTMTVDARVAGRVLLSSVRDGIPCLAIHDAWLVPVRHEGWLYHEICAAWASEFPGRIPRLRRTDARGTEVAVDPDTYGASHLIRRRGGRE